MPWYRLPKSGQAMYFPAPVRGLEEVPDPAAPPAPAPAGSEPPEAEPPAPKRKRSKS